jgi:hypothetical protein
MSYCRVGEDSDVYVIAIHDRVTRKAAWECFCQERSAQFDTHQKILEHLLCHRQKGDRVPEHALERLRREIAENT